MGEPARATGRMPSLTSIRCARGLPVLCQSSYQAQQVARRVLRGAFADLAQRVDQRLELGAKLREHPAEHALRAVVGRLRQRAVRAAPIAMW